MRSIDFLTSFVDPAIALWRERPNEPVLAACAIAQLDILSEVVALGQGDPAFRGAVVKRQPALARIRDAHNSHKHGRLTRPPAADITEGQRAYRSAGTGMFSNDCFVGDLLGQTSSAILLDDGTPLDVGVLITEARDAWDQELRQLKLLP